jgi:hypothetical protein
MMKLSLLAMPELMPASSFLRFPTIRIICQVETFILLILLAHPETERTIGYVVFVLQK